MALRLARSRFNSRSLVPRRDIKAWPSWKPGCLVLPVAKSLTEDCLQSQSAAIWFWVTCLVLRSEMIDCQFMAPIITGNRYLYNRADGMTENYSACMREVQRTEFGQRLFDARAHAGMKQVQAAQAAGIGQSAYAEAEKTGRASRYTAQLAKAFGVSVEWLATGKGQMVPAGKPSETQSTLQNALLLVARSLQKVDELTRIQADALLTRLFSDPSDSVNIADRLSFLLHTPDPAQNLSGNVANNERRATIVVSVDDEEESWSDGASDSDKGAERGNPPGRDRGVAGPTRARKVR